MKKYVSILVMSSCICLLFLPIKLVSAAQATGKTPVGVSFYDDGKENVKPSPPGKLPPIRLPQTSEQESVISIILGSLLISVSLLSWQYHKKTY